MHPIGENSRACPHVFLDLVCGYQGIQITAGCQGIQKVVTLSVPMLISKRGGTRNDDSQIIDSGL